MKTKVNPIPKGYHSLTPPFGHQWSILTHIEDVPIAEMQRRLTEMFEMSHQNS